ILSAPIIVDRRCATTKVVIKEGRICEMGRHEELLAKKGAYAHLYNIQFMQKPTEDKIQSA
ncbi:hypothetical protein, partial [Duodenibacillus massiliensis]|uniref:hypothetical protein n=1 Tax=Duodenibacillus massiliensis TaxID=1852381 RepID=UPI0030792673